MIVTQTVKAIRAAVHKEFAAEFADGRLYELGVYNRRRMRRFWLWSQHAWGNAWDVGVAKTERYRGGAGDRLKAFLDAETAAGRLKVERILWRIINHFGHLHIVGDPRMTGTPPLRPSKEDIDMEQLHALVKGIQQSLLDAGYELPQWGADGVWGAETKAAFDAMTLDAAKAKGTTLMHYHNLPPTTGPVVVPPTG